MVQSMRITAAVWPLVASASFLLWAAPAPAFAQSGVATQDEDIIVTAQRREQALADVPLTISVFDGEALESQGVRTLADIAQLSPGVNVGEAAGTTQISARGVGFGLLTGAGENAVAVHADGIYLSRPGIAGMVQEDLARVEFLRGPQGTLYGRNATGGAINLISPRPSERFEAGAQLGIGNYDLREASFDFGGPLSQQARARAFVSYSDRDGFVDNLTRGDAIDDLTSLGGRVALDIDFTPSLSLQARLFHRTEDFAGPYYDPIDPTAASFVFGLIPTSAVDFDPREIRADAPFDSERQVTGLSAQIDWDLGPATLRSLTGYVDYSFQSARYDGDGTAQDLFAVSRDETSQSLSQEFNIIGASERVDWLIGAYVLDEQVDLALFTTTPAFVSGPFAQTPPIRSIFNPSTEDSQSRSVFADATVRLSPQWSVFGGLRQIWEEREFDNPNILELNLGAGFAPISSCAFLGFPDGRISREDEATTGRFGVSFFPWEGAHFYGQASRGYKSGGFGVSACRNTFEPEELDALEAGVKLNSEDGRLSVQGSIYRYEYTNLQVEQVITTSLLVRNAPEAEITGAELELSWMPTDAFQMSLGLGVLDATYQRFSDADPINPLAGVQNLSGRRLNRAPEWTANLGAQYRFTLADAGSLTARADLYATDDYALRPYQQSRLDFQAGYTTIAGSISYLSASERWGARAWIRNATDEDYIVGMLTSLPGRLATYGPPRTFGVELTYRH